jgi:hypothetical protein
MVAKLKIEKRGDEIKKKSSTLKLLSQSQPNSAEMILGWSPSKTVCGISDLFFYFELGGHLGCKSGSPDTILEGGHPRTIPP